MLCSETGSGAVLERRKGARKALFQMTIVAISRRRHSGARRPIRAGGILAASLCVLSRTPALPTEPTATQRMTRVEAPQAPYRQGLDALPLTEVLQKLHVPGASIAVISDFKIDWVKSYGVADVDSGQPVQVDTLFQAASLSKPLVAASAMVLVQSGRLSLDEDINQQLKSWHVPRNDRTGPQPVTLRALLSHTSGAEDTGEFVSFPPGAPLPGVVQILDGDPLANRPPLLSFSRPPFRSYSYSNGGFLIVQALLVDLLREPFEDIVRTTVLTPLGMSHSTYQQPLSDEAALRAARGHDAKGKRMEVPWFVWPQLAAAGLWTTPSDLARFVIEVQRAVRGPSGILLHQMTARQMIAPTGVGPFGLGLAVSQRGEGWYFRHNGAVPGYRAELVAHYLKGYGLVVMSNGDNGEALFHEIEDRVAAAYGWDTLDKPMPRD